jgi:signal transduction histidine kinase
MSHELRTPMNAIIGMSISRSPRPLAPNAARLRREDRTAPAATLLGMINDILDSRRSRPASCSSNPEEFELAS